MLLTAAADCEAQTNTLSVRPVICFWRRSGGSGFSLGRHPAPGQRTAAGEGSRRGGPRLSISPLFQVGEVSEGPHRGLQSRGVPIPQW